jgi:hypothetical protein
VDAFDDPYARADFNAFSAQFGLVQETSTDVTSTSNQHFYIVGLPGIVWLRSLDRLRGSRVEVETSAVEVDRIAEARPVSETA